jgi:phosphatidylglycerophosphatase A
MKKNILNLFGLGKTKFSASTASLVGAIVYYLVCKLACENVIANSVVFVLVLIWCTFSLIENKTFASQDAREIVADEFLGMYICLLIADTQVLLYIGILFVAFRILDIFKVPPFSTLDKMKNGFGVMADDIAIGIFLGVVFQVIKEFIL